MWWTPNISGGVLKGYDRRLDVAKPTTDSIRILHVYDGASQNHLYEAVADHFVLDDFQTLCNTCCGNEPVFGDVVIPVPIIQVTVSADDNGDYTHVFAIPYNPNNRELTIESSFFNGAAGTAYNGGGFADAAALLAWLQANEAGKGTWSLINNSKAVKLVSTTVKSAGMDIDLIEAAYCFTVPGAGTYVDGVKVAGNVVGFPGGKIDANVKADLIAALQSVLPGTYDGDSHAELLQFTGFDVPQNLTLAGVDVANTAFTAGTCAETFNTALPVLAGGEHYELAAGVFNGVAAAAPAAPGAGTPFADAAALLTWVQANWNEYGTWSLQSGNTVLRLVSTTLDTAVVTVNNVA
jgi:hypothetical protein